MKGMGGSSHGWDDTRLRRAYASAFSETAPIGTVDRVLEKIEVHPGRDPRRLGRGRWVLGLAAGITVLLVLVRLSPTPIGPAATGLAPRTSPGSGLDRFEFGDLSFEYPSTWGSWIQPVPFSGGSSIGVLGTLEPEAACLEQSPWINCYLQQPLRPGDVALRIGSFANRTGQPVVDPSSTAAPGWTREIRTVSGLPAVFSTWVNPVSYYEEDESLYLTVTFPQSLSNGYQLDALYRGPGGADLRAQVLALFDSVRIGPDPYPTVDPGAARTVAAAAIGQLAAWSTGSADGGVSMYSCFPTQPGTDREGAFDYGPSGPLGYTITATCAMDIAPDGERFWRLDLRVDWPEQGGIAAGRYAETFWLSVDGEFAGQSTEGSLPAP